MSHIQNDIVRENIFTNWEEAIAYGDWNDAMTFEKEMADAGFASEAEYLAEQRAIHMAEEKAAMDDHYITTSSEIMHA